MKINIILADNRFKIHQKSLNTLARKVLRGENAAGKSLNIIYCSDARMARLNQEFKKKNVPTDVLAFGFDDENDPDFIGEVYINLQQADRQAKDYNENYNIEIERLTVHGILHLLGYTDIGKDKKEQMWACQEGYL